jgi:hypothetical protein
MPLFPLKKPREKDSMSILFKRRKNHWCRALLTKLIFWFLRKIKTRAKQNAGTTGGAE